ncbi:MAG: hypothetical protein JWO25_2765 [Alphaproteobacteria bacterium]|nr:hypothetical protein [Alphaproteobacteria bacterium]
MSKLDRIDFGSLLVRSKAMGGVGMLLLLIAVGLTGYFAFVSRNDQSCVVTPADRAFPPPSNPQRPRILRVDPVEFQFHKKVCVIVDTAVSPVTFEKLQQELKAAEAAATVAAPAAAAAATRAEAMQSAAAPNGSRAGGATPSTGPSADATKAALAATQAAQARLKAAQQALDSFSKGEEYKLYINGQPSKLSASVEARPDPQPLTFAVQPEEDASSVNASYWRTILVGPSRRGRVPIEIGLGPDDSAAPTATAPVTDRAAGATKPVFFVLYTPLVMWVALAGMAFALLGIAGLARDTPLLREGRTNDRAFSLSRTQMGFWLVLTASGFLYVWLVTGEYKNVFPAALFVLIGISGATAVAAQFTEDDPDEAPASNGFFRDISGDWQGGALQLHRMQIIAWTVILGLIFLWNIAAKLELTSFDTNLLILAGLANGVYVTMKPSESKDKGKAKPKDVAS